MRQHQIVVIAIIPLLGLFAASAGFAQSTSSPPGWAKHAVWYQIFPERFRNGDPTNDPHVEDIWGSWPHVKPAEWKISKWTGDWFALQPWEKIDSNGFYYHTQQRRYGGDLQGIIDKLDYLASLGINAIYINPLFESPSLHKYDASMYHHIDNNFGPDPEGDKAIWARENPADPATWRWTSADSLFLRLIREVHKRKMHIIIDGVFNHVGTTFWAFTDVLAKQQKSPYKDWFYITRWDDPKTAENEFDYRGWVGVKDLPEFRKDSVNGLADGPREHIHSIIRRWMDPNGDGNTADGIDGWRLDAAEMVPLPFWRQFRTWCREINPESYITGEIWWQDWSKNKMFNAAPWLQGDAFDAVMNYRWASETYHFFSDQKNKITATEFDRRLAAVRSDYPSDASYVCMNLLDSHDTDRLPSHIVNRDLLFDHNVGSHDNPAYDNRKPNAAELQTQKLMALFQMTSLGAPMVYYGDEAGMWGGDDPDERKPMLWDDMTYDDEASHPFGAARPRDANFFDKELYSYYGKLIHIRTGHEALQTGTIEPVIVDDARDIYAFRRAGSGEMITIVLNNGQSEAAIELKAPASTTMTDLMTEKSYAVTGAAPAMGTVTVHVQAKSGMILLHNRR